MPGHTLSTVTKEIQKPKTEEDLRDKSDTEAKLNHAKKKLTKTEKGTMMEIYWKNKIKELEMILNA